MTNKNVAGYVDLTKRNASVKAGAEDALDKIFGAAINEKQQGHDVTNKKTIKPVGHTILVEVTPVEEKTSGGIILSNNSEMKRELEGRDVGVIVAMGPLAYRGYKGAIDLKGPEDWGVKVGDSVEFRRYDGKIPRTKGYENHRWLNDEDVIGTVTG